MRFKNGGYIYIGSGWWQILFVILFVVLGKIINLF